MLKQRHFLIISSFLFCCIQLGIIFSPWEIFAEDIKKDTGMIHIVSPGESLNRIAHRYFPYAGTMNIGELIREIKKINGIRGSIIHPKQRLQIPMT